MGRANYFLVQFKTYSTQWNSCLVLLNGPEMYVWIDHRPYRENIAFSFCFTDTVINGPLSSYLCCHRVVHLPTPGREVSLCCTWQLIQTDSHSSALNDISMPLPWRKRGIKIVRVRCRKPVGKHYLLDMMRSLHPWTQSCCGFIDRPAREQANQNPSADLREAHEFPCPAEELLGSNGCQGRDVSFLRGCGSWWEQGHPCSSGWHIQVMPYSAFKENMGEE